MKKSDPHILSRFHSAVRIKISPELLEWLSSYSPKTGHSRRLQYKQLDGERYFTVHELREFDSYLRDAWPSKKGERPTIPTGIVREIESEACYRCAICGTATRESAHIDPVHATSNNHPHNLICLCPTHHTEYDTGVISRGDISALKKRLISARLTLWRLQAQGFDCAISAIAGLGKTGSLPKEINELLTAETLEALGKAAENAPSSEFSKKVSTAVTKKEPVRLLREARNHELVRTGDVDCPLCSGAGQYNGSDCPVCDGVGAVNKHRVIRIDLSSFELVECPLCDGNGLRNGDDCPVCEGDCRMERRFAERVDLKDFQVVDCPLCNGSGRRAGDDCPVCDGNRSMDRRQAEQVDIRDFDEIDCPLCGGSGRRGGDDCPVCHGDRQLDRHLAEQVDLRDFALVGCPLCDGSGRRNGDDCPICQGDRQIDRHLAEQVAIRDFDEVDCPICEGSGLRDGDDCPACHGDRKMDRRHAVLIDHNDFL